MRSVAHSWRSSRSHRRGGQTGAKLTRPIALARCCYYGICNVDPDWLKRIQRPVYWQPAPNCGRGDGWHRSVGPGCGKSYQQMELVAWAEGLGTCFVGLRDERQNAEVKALLGIPSQFQLITILPFGYRQRVIAGAKGRKNRKPLSEVAHSERFEEPYA